MEHKKLLFVVFFLTLFVFQQVKASASLSYKVNDSSQPSLSSLPAQRYITMLRLDLNTGLTQALSDGNYTYLYGVGRIAQTHGSTTGYFLGDALGSARQVADQSGAVTLAKACDPYGVTNQSAGSGWTTTSSWPAG